MGEFERIEARRVIFLLSPSDGPGAMCNRHCRGSQGDRGSRRREARRASQSFSQP